MSIITTDGTSRALSLVQREVTDPNTNERDFRTGIEDVLEHTNQTPVAIAVSGAIRGDISRGGVDSDNVWNLFASFGNVLEATPQEYQIGSVVRNDSQVWLITTTGNYGTGDADLPTEDNSIELTGGGGGGGGGGGSLIFEVQGSELATYNARNWFIETVSTTSFELWRDSGGVGQGRGPGGGSASDDSPAFADRIRGVAHDTTPVVAQDAGPSPAYEVVNPITFSTADGTTVTVPAGTMFTIERETAGDAAGTGPRATFAFAFDATDQLAIATGSEQIDFGGVAVFSPNVQNTVNEVDTAGGLSGTFSSTGNVLSLTSRVARQHNFTTISGPATHTGVFRGDIILDQIDVDTDMFTPGTDQRYVWVGPDLAVGATAALSGNTEGNFVPLGTRNHLVEQATSAGFILGPNDGTNNSILDPQGVGGPSTGAILRTVNHGDTIRANLTAPTTTVFTTTLTNLHSGTGYSADSGRLDLQTGSSANASALQAEIIAVAGGDNTARPEITINIPDGTPVLAATVDATSYTFAADSWDYNFDFANLGYLGIVPDTSADVTTAAYTGTDFSITAIGVDSFRVWLYVSNDRYTPNFNNFNFNRLIQIASS